MKLQWRVWAYFAGIAVAVACVVGCSGVETEGESSIYAAAEAGDMDSIRDAITYGFDVNTPDANGMTLLHHAAGANQGDVIEMLTNDFAASVSAKDNAGRTPLDIARETGSQQAYYVLSQ